MPWIESHTTIGRHPKTRRLCRLLGVDLPAAVGHLHLFWHWVLEFAEDGSLAGFTAEDIADAAYWEGNPQQFVEALIAAGFLDDRGGYLAVHDWLDYAGRLLHDRQRKRSARRGEDSPHQGSSKAADEPPAVHGDSADDPSAGHAGSKERPRNVRGQSEEDPRTIRANRNHNRTVTNQPTDDTHQPTAVALAQTREPCVSSPPDFDAVVEAWNRICAGDGPGPPLPEVLGVTKQRRQRFALRCRELARTCRDGEDVYELFWWERLFERIRASPFLRGESDSGWQVSLDWLLESTEHIVRVLEGAYDARASPGIVQSRPRTNGAVTPERLAELERIYSSSLELPPSELLRRERDAIRRKRSEGTTGDAVT
jgi:hypothetical protein